MTAEERFKKLRFKDDFLTHLSFKLGIEKSTLQNKCYTSISKIHSEKVEKALDLQEKFEKKVLDMQVDVFEEL